MVATRDKENPMKRFTTIIASLAAATALTFTASCNKEESMEDKAEERADQIEEAGEEKAEQIEEAAEDQADQVEEAAEH